MRLDELKAPEAPRLASARKIFATRVRNDLFDSRIGFERKRSKLVVAAWYLTKCVFFLTAIPWPSRLKASLLRVFGAEVGKGVVVKPRINVHFPWNLSLGDHTWLGEEVCIMNFARIDIGKHCCVSQRSFLCSGNHDYRSPDMRYRHAPIAVEDGAWIGASAFVAPGVKIGCDAVIVAMSFVNRPVAAGWVCGGNPCVPLRTRWAETDRSEKT